MKFGMRCAAVAVAICSWFAVSNHCVLAAVAPERDSARSECPFHSKPANKDKQPGTMQCCKILRAVVFARAKGWVRDDAKFSQIDFAIEQFALALLHRAHLPLSLDTGPPGARSFAELILQRSILAHAPPSLA